MIVLGLSNPEGLALDTDGEKIYWTDSGTNKLQRASLDGSLVEDVLTGLMGPQGIALDVDTGKVYWADAQAIHRANLDGSEAEDLALFAHAGGVRGLALDLTNERKMYWVEAVANKIQRSDLDGNNVEDLVAVGSCEAIALDVPEAKMYWACGGKIQRATLDGMNVEDVVTGLSSAMGIALDLRNAIPTVSSWGVVVMVLLGMVAGTVMIRRWQAA